MGSDAGVGLGRLRDGDGEAWQVVFAQYGEALYRYCYCRCGGRVEEADDVRQETFLAALEGIERFRGEVPLFAWLCGIARHKAADAARRRRRLAPLDDDPAMANAETETETDRWEVRERVIETLWALPEEYRSALLCRYVEGEAVATVARRVGRSYKAAESLLSRARRAFCEGFGSRRGAQERNHDGAIRT
jgi:RNA polymerase sigma-70 factor, ECF subfamily